MDVPRPITARPQAIKMIMSDMTMSDMILLINVFTVPFPSIAHAIKTVPIPIVSHKIKCIMLPP
jgi:hypothetical protein